MGALGVFLGMVFGWVVWRLVARFGESVVQPDSDPWASEGARWRSEASRGKASPGKRL